MSCAVTEWAIDRHRPDPGRLPRAPLRVAPSASATCGSSACSRAGAPPGRLGRRSISVAARLRHPQSGFAVFARMRHPRWRPRSAGDRRPIAGACLRHRTAPVLALMASGFTGVRCRCTAESHDRRAPSEELKAAGRMAWALLLLRRAGQRSRVHTDLRPVTSLAGAG